MEICTACKNQATTERCTNKCIKGLNVCGTHARAKTRRNWYEINDLDRKVSKIQAHWKGYATRRRLEFAGPGVLKRSVCHNEEELVSLDPIAKLYPFSYFAFEEDGKIWAFDLQSIMKILVQSVSPQNPYTRTPLSYTTRRRLRDYHNYLSRCRDRYMLIVPQSEILLYRTNLLAQIIHENGFEDYNPEYINALTGAQSYIMRSLLAADMRILALKYPTLSYRRYYNLLSSRIYMVSSHPTVTLICMLFTILSDVRSPTEEYEICFLIMSALYRV